MKRGHLNSSIFSPCIAFAILISAVTVSAQSQSINGQIEGTALDLEARPLGGVDIRVTNIATGIARTATTNREGFYRFPLLTLGIYTISAEAPGFKKVLREAIDLAAGQTITVDL